MIVAYIGNFGPKHSTENHVARAFTKRGHQVYMFQEDDPMSWTRLRRWAERGWPTGSLSEAPDFVLRTRTWERPEFRAHDTVAALRSAGVPTIAFHLDRWFGLNREHEVAEQAMFQCDLVVTADGGHQAEFEAAGVRHRWLPPAVSERECLRTVEAPRSDLDGKIVFVGSTGGYHDEWPWRMDLVQWLRATFGSDFVEIPGPGQPAIRGQGLVDIYAANAVFVGDSCLAGGATRYWSDRVPETLGRRGLLVHPRVEGIEEHFNINPGGHFVPFEVGDFADLSVAIDEARGMLAADGARRVREAAHQHVLAHHTYEVRVDQLLNLAKAQGLL